ncbi:hypothetical protein F5Y03DRAFT_400201 [Xylaria venustula]|nr:hypothetical protein F5Y03DRAFT_400201 [Xylaria venustula]
MSFREYEPIKHPFPEQHVSLLNYAETEPSLNIIATKTSPDDPAIFQSMMASPQKLTEFHYYQKLPAELKLMIWAFHFKHWQSGAHRFRLTLHDTRQNRLALKPDLDQWTDVSAWRERNATARVDKYSFDAFHMELEKLPSVLSFCQLPPPGKRSKKNYGTRALVNDATDLVTFRFNYGTTRGGLNYLNLAANRGVFAGITRIGIEYSFFLQGWVRNSVYMPFQCICQVRTPNYCPKCIVRFLRFFKDLKTFYLVFPIKESLLKKEPAILCQSKPKTSRALERKGKRQLSLDVFRYLEEMHAAEENQDRGKKPEKISDMFHDRMGTYLEVTEANMSNLFYYYPSKTRLARLRKTWDDESILHPEMRPIEFKVLAYIDLRNVNVEGDQQLLRTSAPWH